MTVRILAAALFTLPALTAQASDWPCQIEGPQGMITVYQPQIDTYKENTMSARAALSVTATGTTEPVFGAVWLDCQVVTDGPGKAVRLTGVKVSAIKFPEGKSEETGAITSAIEEKMPTLGITFPPDEVRDNLDAAQKEKETAGEIEVTPPKIIVKDHPAVLVLIDGDPVFIDAEGTSLRRVANTPFFIVQETGSGDLYLKGGETWYRAREIAGPWTAAENPPREAIDLAAKSETEAQAGEETTTAAPETGKIPEIVVSTTPAELIATDGPVQFSPIKETGLLYASNTSSKLFLLIAAQDYYILVSGRWYDAKSLNGPWTYVASDRLPADFARIPPGSERDEVLASVAGTVPAKEAVLDAQIPQTAAVERTQATSQVQYDGQPQFEPIENTDMGYAVNASTAVIRVGGRFYDCDRGVWFVGPTPGGPWAVCDNVPPVIYTIPPRYPVYYTRYVRVYSHTPDVVYVGYTPGYTGSYVYGGTVVYGTGYYYRPWYRRYYYPRPWTWGFGMNYNPWTGWSLGFSTGWWRPRGWFAYNNWGRVREGWWGPVGYRPMYRAYAGPVYREGYRPVYRPALPVRGAATGGGRFTGAVRTPTMYDRWSSGVSRPTAGDRPRQAVDAARPAAGPAPAAAGPRGRQGFRRPQGRVPQGNAANRNPERKNQGKNPKPRQERKREKNDEGNRR